MDNIPQPVILLVGNGAGLRARVESLFKNLGCRVEASRSGEDALRRLEAGLVPDVIFFDGRLPGMSGEQFYRLLRGCPLCQKAALVRLGA